MPSEEVPPRDVTDGFESDNEDNKIADDVADDTTTLAASVTYSRKDGTLSYQESNKEIGQRFLSGGGNADDDDTTTLYQDSGSNVHGFAPPQNTFYRGRTLSDDNMVSSQLSQWNYNNNRLVLNRSILQVKDLLEQISYENSIRPINLGDNERLFVFKLDLKIVGDYTTGSSNENKNNDNDGNNKNNNNRGPSMMGLDKEALAKLFKNRIRTALHHLSSLQKRVDDMSSKVFVTGDLNTGKSAFCNHLLRRHVLPEDQLPCTNVFCEIREARENQNIEEVHAIPHHIASSVKECADRYDIRDNSTYEVYPLSALDELVQQNNKYALLKIYIRDDKRDPEKSLLRNGTVDISLIDSPGLNMDSIQTTEVMARQEEIDLVIFVVNAENQLTLSAKEFIGLASHEKKLMFFVVNKFNRIRDKERCKKLILEQIKDLSPETYKRASEFVHFISESDRDTWPNSGPGGDGPGDDGNDDNDNDNDCDNFRDPNFDNLENSLRNFVLKRRSQSKLLPAKTYLCKILADIKTISETNLLLFQEESEVIEEELKVAVDKCSEVGTYYRNFASQVDGLVNSTVTGAYDHTKKSITDAVNIPIQDLPQYQGLSKIYDFVFLTEEYIRAKIRDSVISSEQFARLQTKNAVEQIYDTGKEEFGDQFMGNRKFDSSLMFTKNLHVLSKNLAVPLEPSDLFDPSWEGFVHYLGWAISSSLRISDKPQNREALENSDVKATASDKVERQVAALGLTDYPLAQYWRRPSLLFTSKLPALVIYSLGGTRIITMVAVNGLSSFSLKTLGQISGSLLLAGALLGISYFINDLPRALPRNLMLKYMGKLQELDYIHSNARRISKEVSDVLKVPSREIHRACDLTVEKRLETKRKLEERRENTRISIRFFKQILDRATAQREVIEAINLDID